MRYCFVYYFRPSAMAAEEGTLSGGLGAKLKCPTPYIALKGGEDRGWSDGSWGCNSCELPDCSSGIRVPLYARRRCAHWFVSSSSLFLLCPRTTYIPILTPLCLVPIVC